MSDAYNPDDELQQLRVDLTNAQAAAGQLNATSLRWQHLFETEKAMAAHLQKENEALVKIAASTRERLDVAVSTLQAVTAIANEGELSDEQQEVIANAAALVEDLRVRT